MGGSSSSASSNATTSQDNRAATDHGVSITGSGSSANVTLQSLDGEIATTAMNTSSANLTASLNTVMGANAAAQATAAQATRDALAAASRATSEAIAGVTTANRDSLTFADRVSMNAMDLTDRAQKTVAESAAEALGFSRSVVDMAFKSADISQQGSANAVNQVARAYDTATNYQAEKATTDSRYLVIAGLVVVALAGMRKA